MGWLVGQSGGAEVKGMLVKKGSKGGEKKSAGAQTRAWGRFLEELSMLHITVGFQLTL